ncbi:MAG TPA: succinylglutamate desuccinylase/aspartoacylase family protein [Candidatus Dormibacteraeota bacterium]|nr:succinylglutamate desuccinylase/aspartoacylase family protein [Candidatus Dormibacteraeota bacterium]
MRGHGALLFPFLAWMATLCAAGTKTPVEVGSARAVAGQKVRGVLKVAESADGTPIILPLTIAAGRKPGPVVWVQAATHGDEYGGARALQDVVRGLDPATMSGTLVAAMIANPPAFQGLSRVNPNWDDLMDSGDAFPGKDRFATERIAAAIHDSVRKNAEYFVDMHTGGDRFRQHPFVLYSVAAGAGTEHLDDLARGFGVPTLWRDAVKIFPTSASTVFSGEGIPGFLLEVGGGQPLDPADVRLQADAIRSFLRAVGILPGSAARLKSYTVVSGYRIVTNARGGFFDAAVKAGDRVKEGTVLGTITDVHGDVVETLRAPAGSDIVLGVSTYPATPTGGWLFELGSGLAETP